MSRSYDDQERMFSAATDTFAQSLRQAVTLPSANIGQSAPLGATVSPDGVNFSLFSRKASSVELLFFDREEDALPSRVIHLDPATNRTYHYWHVFVASAQAGQIYGYRVHGPFDPNNGLRFDPGKILLDPYGRAVIVPKNYDRDAASRCGDNTGTAMKSVIVDPQLYDWEGDEPLKRLSSQTIVYELHVKGFTRHPSSGVPEKTRGTYCGLVAPADNVPNKWHYFFESSPLKWLSTSSRLQRVSCFDQYDRIDDLIPFNLRGDKCPVFRQFLVDEFHLPAVFKFLDPLFVWHVCSPSSEVQGECLTPSRWLSSLIVAFDVFSCDGNLNVSTLFEVPLRYSCRLGHARLCHFLLDAGTRRPVGVSLTFLMQHAPSMASR